MAYLNSITLVGFVGSDPQQRQAKGNGSKFTVLSVATQRSWKNADDEWSSKTEWHRVVVFRPLLAERVATTIKKGAHVLVEGSLVSSTYEQPNGKGKKSKTSKITSWSVRADVMRRLDRGDPEPNAPAPVQALESNEAALSCVRNEGPPTMSEGLFYLFASTISPPLRFGSALCPVAEEALGRQVSEHWRDGSATIKRRYTIVKRC